MQVGSQPNTYLCYPFLSVPLDTTEWMTYSTHLTLVYPAGNLTPTHPQSTSVAGHHFQSLCKLHSRWQHDIDLVKTLCSDFFFFWAQPNVSSAWRGNRREPKKGGRMTDKRKRMLPEEETYKTLEEAHIKTETITSNSSHYIAGLVLLVFLGKQP